MEVGLSRVGSIQEVRDVSSGDEAILWEWGEFGRFLATFQTGPKRDSLGVGRNCAVSSMSLRLIVTGGTVTRVKNFEWIGAKVE